MAKPGIAFQLFSARKEAAQDLVGTLKELRKIGWEYVQWSGMPPLDGAGIREALDAADLKGIAAHCPVEPFEADFETEVAKWKTAGIPDVAPGGMMADCHGSRDAWLNGAKRLDRLGAKLRQAGMRLSYHNHSMEFAKFPGDDDCKLDILYAAADPSNLCAELDTAWVYDGGADPAAYIRKYAGRCPLLHVKDLTGEKEGHHPVFTELGGGILDWPAIFDAGRASGVEWYIYEQDNVGDRDNIFESAAISLRFLRTSLGL